MAREQHEPAVELEQAYREGVRLFNAGAFWHAHEQWEECWRQAHEPDATFYKGIIQAAAALVHWQKGNLRGLRRNWEKSRPKLVALPRVMHGLELGRLIAEMDQFVRDPSTRTPPRLCEATGSGAAAVL